MWTLMLLAQAVPAAAPADPVLAPAAALYDEVCLKAFPDDGAIDAAMKAKGATPLTAAQVKTTLVDDPGRGWSIDAGGQQALVFLELPPYHACSIRWSAPGIPPDLAPYRRVADAYAASRPGFAAIVPVDQDAGDIHISATGIERDVPGGGHESLFVIDQHVSDAKRRAAGETGVMRRLVHQLSAGKR